MKPDSDGTRIAHDLFRQGMRLIGIENTQDELDVIHLSASFGPDYTLSAYPLDEKNRMTFLKWHWILTRREV